MSTREPEIILCAICVARLRATGMPPKGQYIANRAVAAIVGGCPKCTTATDAAFATGARSVIWRAPKAN